jgi:ATP-dependent DNA helicase RecG
MPNSAKKLYKFLKLEIERGYDNRAVVGGLDRIIPNWQIEARGQKLDHKKIQSIVSLLSEYRYFHDDERPEAVQDMLNILETMIPHEPAKAPVIAASPKQKTHAEVRVEDQEREQEREPEKEIEPELEPESKPEPKPEPEKKPEKKAATKQSLISPPVEKRQKPSADKKITRKLPKEKPLPTVPDMPTSGGLESVVTIIPGIGPKNAETLKNLGIQSIRDLLYHFPRRYDDYSQLKPINRLEFGDEITIIASVKNIQTRKIRNGKQTITEAVVSDDTGYLRITWFSVYPSKQLSAGDQIVLSGKVDMYLGRLVMTSPDWEVLEETNLHTNRIVPVYPLTAEITQKRLRKILFNTVYFWSPRTSDYLPRRIRNNYGLVTLSTALMQIHFPDSEEQLEAARARLAFDEIFLLQLGLLRQKRNWQSATARVFDTPNEWIASQISALPFSLTEAQKRVIRDIQLDLLSSRPMNRLLQGDVGSGKTIVAAMAMGMIVRAQCQAAIMAPTGILAEQHFRNLRSILCNSDTPGGPILQDSELQLMVGDTPESKKIQIREGLETGSIKLVIGTHALIEAPVIFKNLQLIIIDEQHRFGVSQRAALRQKGNNPHLMVMTATPIPRSMALTIYGDLDISVIDEMPVGRQLVETHVLRPVERERSYSLISGQIRKGHQAFIIYPLIEKGEKEEIKAAVEEHQRLQKDIFSNKKIGLLHGRMKPNEKEQVMAQFRDGHYEILVSTSVVEVGVDIPNATVMVIEGANRFGLAQLHQFRGRVGRGAAKSYCLLIPETPGAVENERLITMEETNDGFVLAERDLEQRGPGDFLGTRQAGFTDLKIASLTDIRLIEQARQAAQEVFKSDADLSSSDYDALKQVLDRFWTQGKGDVS